MNSKVLLVFVVSLLYLVHVAKSWQSVEDARVEDETLRAQGYACKFSDTEVGLMKHEDRWYLKDCIEVRCNNEEIIYTGCGVVGAGPGCYLVQDIAYIIQNAAQL